jgi:hypothetical protein
MRAMMGVILGMILGEILGLDIDALSHYLICVTIAKQRERSGKCLASAQLAFAPALFNGTIAAREPLRVASLQRRPDNDCILNFGLKSETSHECSRGPHTRYGQSLCRTGAYVREGQDQQPGFLLW